LNAVLNTLNENLDDRALSKSLRERLGYGLSWTPQPARSGPARLFLIGLSESCSLQKQSAHSKRSATKFPVAVISVSEETAAAVLQNFPRRLQMVLKANGANIKNTFTPLKISQDYLTETSY
jgi:hypothetical protein